MTGIIIYKIPIHGLYFEIKRKYKPNLIYSVARVSECAFRVAS